MDREGYRPRHPGVRVRPCWAGLERERGGPAGRRAARGRSAYSARARCGSRRRAGRSLRWRYLRSHLRRPLPAAGRWNGPARLVHPPAIHRSLHRTVPGADHTALLYNEAMSANSSQPSGTSFQRSAPAHPSRPSTGHAGPRWPRTTGASHTPDSGMTHTSSQGDSHDQPDPRHPRRRRPDAAPRRDIAAEPAAGDIQASRNTACRARTGHLGRHLGHPRRCHRSASGGSTRRPCTRSRWP